MNLNDLMRYAKALDYPGSISIKRARAIAKNFDTVSLPHMVLIRLGYLEKTKNDLTRTGMTYREFCEKLQALMVCLDDSTAAMVLATIPTSQSSIILEIPENRATTLRRIENITYPIEDLETPSQTNLERSLCEIVDFVKSHPGATMADIHRYASDSAYCTTYNRVYTLKSRGLISSQKYGIVNRYWAVRA